jgi:hypothetical protein
MNQVMVALACSPKATSSSSRPNPALQVPVPSGQLEATLAATRQAQINIETSIGERSPEIAIFGAGVVVAIATRK